MRTRLTSPLTPLLYAAARTSDTLRLGQLHGFESGLVCDRIYACEASGRYGVGKALDAWVLAQPAAEALRERHLLVKAALRHACAEAQAGNRRPVLLDLGSGPGRAVIEVLRHADTTASALCVDLDGACLRAGRTLAVQAQLDTVRFEWANALDIDKLARWARPTLVLAAGLYDYLGDDAVRASLHAVRARLRPNTFVFTAHVRRNHAPLASGRWTPGGRTRLRPLEAWESWARGAGYARAQSQLTRDGTHAVFTLTG